MNTPNILFVFSDQQRWDTVGCYGQKLPITPNLDKLASEGVRFENAFTCQPVCGPARACLQTGLYATQIGAYRNAIGLPVDADTIAKQMNKQGYQTAYVGKWHLAKTVEHDAKLGGTGSNNGMRPPVPEELRGGYKDYWLAADMLEFTSESYFGYMHDKDNNKVEFKDQYRADFTTDCALKFLNNHTKEKPFFMFVSYIEPHHQNNNNRYEGPTGSKEKFKNYDIPADLVGTEGDWRENFPDYLGCCNSLDENVGRMVDALKKNGEYENTVIIYTSDHGTHFRTRNDEYKRTCHENAIRIPMIIRGGEFNGGKVIEELASLIDLPKTMLAIAGIDCPETWQGISLCDAKDGKIADRECVFYQISESHVGRGIRTKKWKYAVCAPGKDGWYDSCSDVYREAFLYDLENDYIEKSNLISAPAYAEIRTYLKNLLLKEMEKAGEKQPEILPCTE